MKNVVRMSSPGLVRRVDLAMHLRNNAQMVLGMNANESLSEITMEHAKEVVPPPRLPR